MMQAPRGRPSVTRRAPSVGTLRFTHHGAWRATAYGADAGPASVLAIPLFPLPSVLHPAQSGHLVVYEPRFLELFRDLRLSTPPGSPPRFGHILAPSAAPPALLEADGGAVSGMPAIGVCATVRSQSLDSQGHLLVEYEGMRRFRLLGLDDVSKPYMIGMACWLDDEPPQNAGPASAPAAVGPGAGVDTAGLEWRPEEWQARVDALEAEVLGTLREVARLSSAVGAPADALPESIERYAPPREVQLTSADALIRAGHPAGAAISMWRRHGSVYGPRASRSAAGADPYQAMRECLVKEQRQQLFSFAAASVLEMRTAERLALLHTRDTAARLQYVLAALQPHLADLVARFTIKSNLGG